MGTQSVLETIRNRRTIRRFTNQAVSEDQVRAVLAAGMSAPSVMNRRPWHFVVLRDPATKKAVAEAMRLHPYVQQAPVLLVALADTSVSPGWRLDLSASVENIHLAAAGLGLGSAWIGAPDLGFEAQTEEMLRKLFGLPDTLKLFAFVALGYPAEQRAGHEADAYLVSTRVHFENWEGLKF
jgi:nitroreductase